MTNYTVELRKLIDSNYDLGMTTYPIFDAAYRVALNTKIKNHFYFREIGFETAGRFKFHLNAVLNEVMPLYNKMYNSELLVFNPLYNTDVSEENSRENSANATSINSNKTDVEQLDDTLQVHSDTPGGLLNVDDLKSNTWASDATRQDNSIKTGTTGSAENTNASQAMELYVKHVSGNSGISNSQLLTDFRATFLNIDMMVIHELDGLFMGLLE